MMLCAIGVSPNLGHRSSSVGRLGYWALIVGFFLAGVVTRIPFRSHMLYHWDSVNFALALEHFDLRLDQPHSPGYVVYVFLGWVMHALTGDPNQGYVWLSVLFSGLMVAVMFVLGWEMFGPVAGIGAALLALTSPAVWFYGELALTYILEAFFVAAIALAAYRVLGGQRRWVWLATVLLGVAGGVRQTTLVLFLPLWLFMLWHVPWKQRIGACVLLGVLVLAWLVPTVALTGGLNIYLAAARGIGGGVLSGFALFGGESLVAPLGRLLIYLVYGLMGGIPLLGYLVIRRIGSLRRLWMDRRIQVLGLWLVPNLVFYAPLVRAPGHVFSFLPALLVLAGAGMAVLRSDVGRRGATLTAVWMVGVVGVLLAGNVAFYLAAPPHLFGDHRVAFSTPSWPTIRYRDNSLETRIAYIRAHFPAGTTAILSSGTDFRHPDFYLRGYTVRRFAAPPLAARVALPEGIDTIVLLGEELHGGPDAQGVALPDGEELFYLHLRPGQEVMVNQASIELK